MRHSPRLLCPALLAGTLVLGLTISRANGVRPTQNIPTENPAHQMVNRLYAGNILVLGEGQTTPPRFGTRYEFAGATARGLDRLFGPKALSSLDSAALDDLSQLTGMFSTEMTTLGVDVDRVRTRLETMIEEDAERMAEKSLRPITHAPGVLAVVTHNEGRRSSDGPLLVVAAWKDGTVIWSKDTRRGGPPYRTARIEPTRYKALIKELETYPVFTEENFPRTHFGPDSDYMTIVARNGLRRREMRSWHELYESDTTVATAGGLEPLNGRVRAEVLAAQPKEYRQFREGWSRARASLVLLTRTQPNQPINGRLEVTKGAYFWRTLPEEKK